MRQPTILILVCLIGASAGTTTRGEENSVVISGPILVGQQHAQPEVVSNTVVEEVPLPDESSIASGVELVPVRSIKYDTRPSARRVFARHGTVDTVLAVDDPADCRDCLYEVPVCLPCCCTGDPTVNCRRGFLGRSVVEYCWPCGYEIEVIFRLRGDLKVMFNAD